MLIQTKSGVFDTVGHVCPAHTGSECTQCTYAHTHTLPRAAPCNTGRLPLQRRTPAHVFLPETLCLPAHGGPPPHICFSPRLSSSPGAESQRPQCGPAQRMGCARRPAPHSGLQRRRHRQLWRLDPAATQLPSAVLKFSSPIIVFVLALSSRELPPVAQALAFEELQLAGETLRPLAQPLASSSCYRFEIVGTRTPSMKRRVFTFLFCFLCFSHVAFSWRGGRLGYKREPIEETQWRG